MDQFQPDYVKKLARDKENKAKSMWLLSYQAKGMAVGLGTIFLFCYFKVGEYPLKYLIAAGVCGAFFGWLVGNFFYTKKE